MMVTFVSQCEKKALQRTRKVLDAFADRIGKNTWQTVITQEGLLAVKKSLRKTASKNTAVSCHWIRSRSRSELAWVVGNKDKFNAQGLVPVNYTRRQTLGNNIENDWVYLPLIKALVGVSALLHDWGKATALFQKKLDPDSKDKYKGDPIRHEWVSLLLLRAIVTLDDASSDEAWLRRLMEGDINEALFKKYIIPEVEKSAEKPLMQLPPAAKLVAWLIVTHHRLPLLDKDAAGKYLKDKAESIDAMLARITKKWGYENNYDEKEYRRRLKQCFKFPKGLMSESKPWMTQLKKWAQRLYENQSHVQQVINDGSYRVILTHSRLCLMLGDHFFSSQPQAQHWRGLSELYANTDRKTSVLKQKLDEHLVGVAKQGVHNVHRLPVFESALPMAEDLNHLKKRSPKAFAWQDKAVDRITAWCTEQDQHKQKKYGFFTVNMASTGCGKTFANAKIMRALSPDRQSLRFSLALGLRTLTLQTGDEYRDRVGLDDSDLAVLIGSRAVMELHHSKAVNKDEGDGEENSYEKFGSASEETLLDDDIDFDGVMDESGLDVVLTSLRDKQFLYAPVLACTIDHLMAATETKRGGRYILPTLRLMSSDLVIDEIDDFTDNDLIAIGRLIHLAGMLGRKVMISSATISPFIAEGYFNTYREGWKLYSQTRNVPCVIGCAWVDEFTTQVTTNAKNKAREAIEEYRASHTQFISQRVAKLQQQPAKRKADIYPCQEIITHDKKHHKPHSSHYKKQQEQYFEAIAKSLLIKHSQHHRADEITQAKVSFGVVRVANISPCVALTRYLLDKEWPSHTEVRVMAYHSQQVLLLRSLQEKHLDNVLRRKEKNGEIPKAFTHPIIRGHLSVITENNSNIKHVIFVVVATPVEEVGRDHDFDWAVIEPSSYRSIVQLAGRVMRHRQGEVDTPNISLMQYNWKGIQQAHDDTAKVFNRPGFENKLCLHSHDITALLDVASIEHRVDAIPRIQMLPHLTFNAIKNTAIPKSLIDLEHIVTWHYLANYRTTGENAKVGPASLQGWLTQHWFLSGLPQVLTPFRQSEPSISLYLVFDPETQASRFCEKSDDGEWVDRENIVGIERMALSGQSQQRLWLVRDFDQACENLVDEKEISQRWVSMRYGEIHFVHRDNQTYEYSDQLGLVKI